MGEAVRISDDGAVRRLTLCRPAEYNTITPQLRDELGAALDAAQGDRVGPGDPARRRGPGVLRRLRARLVDGGPGARRRAGPSGRGTAPPTSTSSARSPRRGPSCTTRRKPTVAAVSGWCIAGGTNIVFNAHLIVAGESARFGYPPSRVWGVPEAPWTWVARMGMQQARRYMLTGDEFTAAEALEMGVVLDVVPDDELADALDGAGPAHRPGARPTSSR